MIEEGDMIWTCSIHGRTKKCTQNFGFKAYKKSGTWETLSQMTG